ncbi:AAA family ATPase [Mycolicibacterium sp.]|uniref:AAA family ATPase n=1 Tax=Mycolicibacterium sp. TaxID=2320850 RepID=UPI0037CC25DC
MADDYQIRKRLLALDSADVGLIAAQPGLGWSWTKRANVRHSDLTKGSQRALMGLKAAMTKDSNSFATDLAKLWENVIVPQLGLVTDEPDPTLFGVRSSAVLIGGSGARALVSCLAAAHFDVSVEMAERFDELSAAADHPLSDDELKAMSTRLEQHLPEQVLAKSPTNFGPPETTVNREPDLSAPALGTVYDGTSVHDLGAAGAQELVAELREHADRVAGILSAAVENVLAGNAVDVHDVVCSWNTTLTHAWIALGGPGQSESPSFKMLDTLQQQIVERESSAAAKAARSQKLAKLAQLRQTVATLEPMIHENESFRTAYQVACAQANALEDELGVTAGDIAITLDDHDESHGVAEEDTAKLWDDTQPIVPSDENAYNAAEDDDYEAFTEVTDNAIGIPDEPVRSRSHDTPAETANRTQCSALPIARDAPVHPNPAVNTASVVPEIDSAVEGVEPRPLSHDNTHETVPTSTDGDAEPIDKPAPCEYTDELTFHVGAGRFGAAWLVAWASGLPEHEVDSYRLAAAAFHSVPGGGIDPSEVLIRLTTTLSDDTDFSCQSARIALAATLRAALAAGWSPRSEVEVMATHANLDAPGRDLISAVIAASDRAYQHLHDLGGSLSFSNEDVQENARGLRTELEGLRIKFARADKVLKYLLRASEPIGAAIGAVLADTTGDGRRDALTTALAMLESPDDVIDAADSAVSTPQQRRNPIESHALRRLRRAIEAAAECVTQALNSAVVVADDSRTVVVQDVRNALIAAANAVPALDIAGPGDAALARLLRWITEPDPPTRVPSEVHLLLDESLPAVSAPRDDDGLPLINSECASAVVDELRSPGSWHTLFDAYVDRGDLQEADAVARHAPELLDQMATARTDWKRRLEREVSVARADLARTYADGAMRGPQADNAQVEAEAQLVAPGEYTGDRYDRQMADLAQLRAALADHRAGTAEHLRERVQGEVGNESDRNRIIALIDAEDFVGANELLALARRGPLPPTSQDQSVAGSHLFDEFVDALAAVHALAEPSVHDLVAAFSNGRLDEVDESDKARLGSWGDLVLRGRLRSQDRSGKLFAVLRALGLDTRGEPSRQTSPGVRHFDLFRVHASPVDGSLVPGLGSQATHYMVAVTADHKLLRETLTSGFPVKNGPNIVLFDGLLTMDQRRQCLSVCREKKISAIVVDHAVAAFVAARYPRSFRAVQQLTLPFTCFTHYTVVAGNVPDEVFVGRDDELTQLTDRTGSLFVYGGRQLGKSALLRKIQREFNVVADHHAIFIDLNSHGIGTWADPQQLWPVLHNELAKIGSMGIKANPAVRNHDVVTKAIRQWLEGKDSRRLLLLLDEADAFLEKESREAPNGFRNIGPLKGLFDDSEGRFKPVFAGLHKVQRLQNVANTPLAHGGRDVLIGPLAAKPARDLVVKPLEALGYRFDNPEAVWRLLAFTNLQPGLIQLVCNDLVAHLQSRPLRKGEPLITISDTDVDFVTAHETTRSKIAEKLRLTIALEDRYRVIALAVAIMSMEDNFGSGARSGDSFGHAA